MALKHPLRRRQCQGQASSFAAPLPYPLRVLAVAIVIILVVAVGGIAAGRTAAAAAAPPPPPPPVATLSTRLYPIPGVTTATAAGVAVDAAGTRYILVATTGGGEGRGGGGRGGGEGNAAAATAGDEDVATAFDPANDAGAAVVAIDARGGVRWRSRLGGGTGTAPQRPAAIAVAAGRVFVVGSVRGALQLGRVAVEGGGGGAGLADAYVVALHATNGSVGWAWQGGTAANDAFRGLAVTGGRGGGSSDTGGSERGGGEGGAVGFSAGRLWAPPDAGGSGSVSGDAGGASSATESTGVAVVVAGRFDAATGTLVQGLWLPGIAGGDRGGGGDEAGVAVAVGPGDDAGDGDVYIAAQTRAALPAAAAASTAGGGCSAPSASSGCPAPSAVTYEAPLLVRLAVVAPFATTVPVASSRGVYAEVDRAADVRAVRHIVRGVAVSADGATVVVVGSMWASVYRGTDIAMTAWSTTGRRGMVLAGRVAADWSKGKGEGGVGIAFTPGGVVLVGGYAPATSVGACDSSEEGVESPVPAAWAMRLTALGGGTPALAAAPPAPATCASPASSGASAAVAAAAAAAAAVPVAGAPAAVAVTPDGVLVFVGGPGRVGNGGGGSGGGGAATVAMTVGAVRISRWVAALQPPTENEGTGTGGSGGGGGGRVPARVPMSDWPPSAAAAPAAATTTSDSGGGSSSGQAVGGPSPAWAVSTTDGAAAGAPPLAPPANGGSGDSSGGDGGDGGRGTRLPVGLLVAVVGGGVAVVVAAAGGPRWWAPAPVRRPPREATWVPPATAACRPAVGGGGASVATVRRRHFRPAGDRRSGAAPSLPTSLPAFSGALPPCMAAPLPPRNIGGTTKALKAALQAALQSRLSRMVVELPVGARYGVEKASVDGSDDASAGADAAPTAASVAVSDRELARLVVAMFAGNGLGIVTLFRDAAAAAAATKAWGRVATADCTVTSWDAVGVGSDGGINGLAKKKKQKTKAGGRKGGGFGAPPPPAPVKPAPTLYGAGTDVVLVVAPGPSQLARLARLSDEAGPGTVLVILNGRLDNVAHPSPALRDHFTGNESPWTRVLVFRPGPHPGWAGGVLYRQFPEPYVLCRKARLGPPIRLAEFADAPPSLDEIDATLRATSEAEGGPGGEGGARAFRSPMVRLGGVPPWPVPSAPISFSSSAISP
ncbi:hypothetical protein MMPV_004222 [Pyropia vietnamensis]